MKKAVSLLIITLGCFTLSPAQEAAATFNDAKVDLVFKQYFQLKDALVASKPDEAKIIGGQLQQSLMALNKGKKGPSAAGKIGATNSLDDQRKAFSALSDEMNVLVKTNKPATGTLYVEFCPMANDDQGAYWLSKEKEIRNPYFGDKMLKCGYVKETIQ